MAHIALKLASVPHGRHVGGSPCDAERAGCGNRRPCPRDFCEQPLGTGDELNALAAERRASAPGTRGTLFPVIRVARPCRSVLPRSELAVPNPSKSAHIRTPQRGRAKHLARDLYVGTVWTGRGYPAPDAGAAGTVDPLVLHLIGNPLRTVPRCRCWRRWRTF